MCLPNFFCLTFILPYVLLILLPIFGSFCGKDVVLRFSMLLYLQCGLSSFFNGNNSLTSRVSQLSVWGVLLVVPLGVVPYTLLWLYDLILCASEPVLQLVEAVGAVKLTMIVSREVLDRMDDQPGLAKLVYYFLVGFSYSVSTLLGWQILESESLYYKCVLAGVLVVLIIVHIITLLNENGVVTDTAVVSLCSVLYVYAMYQDSVLSTSAFIVPPQWTHTHVLDLLYKLLSPWLLCSALLRLFSILYMFTLLKAYFLTEEEDEVFADEADDDEDEVAVMSHWCSSLSIQLIIIFIYTQFLIYYLHRSPFFDDQSWLSWLRAALLPSARWLQLLTLNGLYVFCLCMEDDSPF